MYVIDLGRNQATIYNSEIDEVKTISHEQILDLPNELPEGSLIVSEYAHLGCPKKEKSLAQVFEADTLLKFYSDLRDKGITLKLFPQQLTPRACNYSRLPKGDDNDPKSIYILLRDFPEISLMNPPKTFELSPLRQESYDWVEWSNLYLNIPRCDKYSKEDVYYGVISENLQYIYDNISETCRSVFGFEVYKRGNKKEGISKGDVNIKNLKMNQIYSVLVQLMNDKGELRLRDRTGELAGWKFIKRYSFKMTAFHFKGGVARSNLYHHGIKNWVAAQVAQDLGVKTKDIKNKRRGGYTNDDREYVEPFTKEENELFRKYRAQYCKCIKEMFMLFKSILTDGVQSVIPAQESVKPTQTLNVQKSLF